MRLGLIARADNSGLGIQTLEFYRHMKPAKTMVVDISKLNHNATFNDRYSAEDCMFVKGFPAPHEIESFLQDLDVVFIAESSYNRDFYDMARAAGVKTAVQYNYEFFDWFDPNMPKPDMLIAPSRWHFRDIDDWCAANQVRHTYLHCPVARDKLPFRQIRAARTFLHVAGRSAAHDRNGTNTVIEASKYISTDANFKIHFQGEQGLPHQATNTVESYKQFLMEHGDPSRVEIVQEDLEDYQDVYKTGDVLLYPRRYGGNCLPMNEALSVGMPVVMPDISPNNSFLPQRWLVAATKIGAFSPRPLVDIDDVSPKHLARKIDWFYNMGIVEMIGQNVRANNLAESISWPNQRPLYERTLESLCTP